MHMEYVLCQIDAYTRNLHLGLLLTVDWIHQPKSGTSDAVEVRRSPSHCFRDKAPVPQSLANDRDRSKPSDQNLDPGTVNISTTRTNKHLRLMTGLWATPVIRVIHSGICRCTAGIPPETHRSLSAAEGRECRNSGRLSQAICTHTFGQNMPFPILPRRSLQNLPFK